MHEFSTLGDFKGNVYQDACKHNYRDGCKTRQPIGGCFTHDTIVKPLHLILDVYIQRASWAWFVQNLVVYLSRNIYQISCSKIRKESKAKTKTVICTNCDGE